jgi:hypothetical protein
MNIRSTQLRSTGATIVALAEVLGTGVKWSQARRLSPLTKETR